MRLGKVITLVAVLGIAGFAATNLVQAGSGGSCCPGDKASKASMKASAGCSGQATTTKAGGSCAGMSSAACKTGMGCPAMGVVGGDACASAKGASMECEMTPADCEKMIRAYYKAHGWLGIEMVTADGSATPTVTAVTPGSPAEKVGFKVGDVLTSLNGISIEPKNAEALQKMMEDGFAAGQTVTYTAKREAQVVTLSPVLASIPDANLNQMVAAHLTAAHKQQTKSS